MIKIRKYLLLLVMPLAIFAPGTINAATGHYAGISAGEARFKQIDNSEYTSNGYKLYAGMAINSPLIIEISHAILGSYINDTVKISGNSLHGAYLMQIDNSFSATAKFGITSWEVEYVTLNTIDNGTGLSYGFALTYALFSRIGIKLEWERFSDVGKNENATGVDIDMTSIGVCFYF